MVRETDLGPALALVNGTIHLRQRKDRRSGWVAGVARRFYLVRTTMAVTAFAFLVTAASYV
jgi:hypothetical protein